jgi:hypothetical protein
MRVAKTDYDRLEIIYNLLNSQRGFGSRSNSYSAREALSIVVEKDLMKVPEKDIPLLMGQLKDSWKVLLNKRLKKE